MKKITLYMLCLLITGVAYAQDGDTVKFTLGHKRLIVVDTQPTDSTDGDKELQFSPWVEDDKKKNFKSYLWEGVGIGVTGYVTPNNEVSLPAGQQNFELDMARSIGVNLNFGSSRIDIARHGLGLVTGLGLDFKSYAFKNNTVLTLTGDTVIAGVDSTVNFNKNKLRSTYLQVPLMVDINTSAKSKKGMHLGFGVIGGVRIGSKLKQKYEVDGDPTKIKTRSHYHLRPFTADATLRIGFGQLNFYANYGLLSVFEKGKGPELIPFELGVLISM